MTYEEALNYIHGTLKFGVQPGLAHIGTLLSQMGNPQKGQKFVHVAGTNGKGSTSSAIASVLQAAGYKTGLYISPYIEDFCERMQVNSQDIPHEKLAEITEYIIPFVEKAAGLGAQPTEFELCTAIAFEYFKRSGCDITVLEVGLGGRFDATNIIECPLVSVITSISLDHTRVLGGTLGEIAFEKCGIIKEGGITVSAPEQDPEALAVIMESCAEHGNTLIIPNLNAVKVLEENFNGSTIEYKNQTLKIPLTGRHQHKNFTTAYEALEALRTCRGLKIPEEAVLSGFSNLRFPARFEKISENPLVFIDGAHNPAGAATLADTVKRYLNGRRLAVVMGIFADKDYVHTIGQIASLADSFYAVEPPNPRALAAEETARTASQVCKNVLVCRGLPQAFQQARANAGADGAVLICGSLSLAGKMRTIL